MNENIQMRKHYEQKIDNMKTEYDEKIDKLINKLTDIASSNKIINYSNNTINNNKTQINNYINNLELVTDDFIKDNVSKLTLEHIKKGPEGYAEYVLNNPLKNRIICTDFSRRKIKYKNEEGDLISDPNFLKLSKKIFPNLNEMNEKLITEYREQLEDLYPEIEERIEVLKHLIDYNLLIKQGFNDDTKEIYNDFVKNLCLKSLPGNYLCLKDEDEISEY